MSWTVARHVRRALRLRATVGSSGDALRHRRGLSSGADQRVGTPKEGATEMGQAGAELEELSVFTAVGGLTAAAAGGVGVFAIGAAATLGVASGAAALLGHNMNPKTVPNAAAAAPSREDLVAELAYLRKQPRSKETDEAKATVKARIKAMGK